MNQGKNWIQKPGENKERILVLARKIKENENEACIVVLVITKGKRTVLINNLSCIPAASRSRFAMCYFEQRKGIMR